MVNFEPDKACVPSLIFAACNTPDILLLLEALREVPDGSDSLLCGQGHQFLNQVLFLCQMSGNKKKEEKNVTFAQECTQKGKIRHPQWLPFSNSATMASSVMVQWA